MDIDDADYYNVTVNLIVKRKSKFSSDQDSNQIPKKDQAIIQPQNKA